MTKLRVLSLFAGIGGFDLGLERTGGFETVAFCEIEPFPRAVLAKHWPGVPCYDDVRTLTAGRLAADGIGVDVIVGGFPCQDISTAGAGAGIDGKRSGLWSEYARLIGELRPRFVVVENVSALLGRGLSRVLVDLAEIRFDAEWHAIPASAVGARHRRDRVWVVAYPAPAERQRSGSARTGRDRSSDGGQVVADALGIGRPRSGQYGDAICSAPRLTRQTINAVNGGIGDIWRTEPDVGRVANGVSARAHRLRALGNAVVPQIPELIGRAILASMVAA